MQLHIFSFEGPGPHSWAGEVAVRVAGRGRALPELAMQTDLWFLGNPDLPSHEDPLDLHLHREAQR